jgi:replicative DNA helicase
MTNQLRVIIEGRPGGGKTCLGLLIMKLLRREGISASFRSDEMTPEELTRALKDERPFAETVPRDTTVTLEQRQVRMNEVADDGDESPIT